MTNRVDRFAVADPDAGPAPDPAVETGRWRTFRKAGGAGLLSVVDQCLFSGTNFLTAVLIGRTAGARELGLYALCFSLVMTAIVVQRALLVSPFVVISPGLQPAQRQGMRASMLRATLALGTSLGIAGLMAGFWAGPWLAMAMSIALISGLLRDFHRRLAIADSRLLTAIRIDGAIAILQLTVLAWMAFAGGLTAASTLLACSAVWFLVSTVGFALTRRNFAFGGRSVLSDVKQLWPIGKWVGLSQLVSTMQAFTLPWVMALAHSMELAGIYAACWTLVQVASPAIEGLGNILGPALARSMFESKQVDLRRKTWIATCLFGGLMLSLLVVFLLAGRWLLEMSYGAAFASRYSILLVLTMAATLGNVGIPSSKALTQLGRASTNFWIAAVSFSVTALMGAILLSSWGSSGAAWGLVVGASVSTFTRWIILASAFRDVPLPTASELSPPPPRAT